MTSPVLIISTLGASHAYPDQEMLRRTCLAWLGSLQRQIDPEWRLFLACHDVPDWLPSDPRISLHSISGDTRHQSTFVYSMLPDLPTDVGKTEIQPYGQPITDMSRKTFAATIAAGRWAWVQKLKSFWVLRMDSDDLLAHDHVAKLRRAEARGIGAVYNKACHMFDPRAGEIARYVYPYTTTCNALLMRFGPRKVEPDWYYHCRDHTTFKQTVHRDKIKALQVDDALCIITNSGNSISGRNRLETEEGAKKIRLTQALVDRYGLEALL